MDATRGTLVIPKSAAAASAGDNTTEVTRPARPAMLPKITPGVSGATNNARPVASVFRRSPFENVTSTPGVSLPLTSRTASVARSPDTICLGNSKMRAPAAAGAGGGTAGRGTADCAADGACCAAACRSASAACFEPPNPASTANTQTKPIRIPRMPIDAIVEELLDHQPTIAKGCRYLDPSRSPRANLLRDAGDFPSAVHKM